MSSGSFGGIGFGGVSQTAISQISRGVATTAPKKNETKEDEVVAKNDDSAKKEVSRQSFTTGKALNLSAQVELSQATSRE